MNDLIEWLREKIIKAEKDVVAREQSEDTWRGGTNKSWAEVGCRLTKAERHERADIEKRIAIKCRREVEMYKSALAIINQTKGGTNAKENQR